jgi:GNAT superfamily N-acetyltransferase
MSSLYWEYIKEREGLEVLQVEDGFILYAKLDKQWYITDFFVRPEARNKGVGQYLWHTFCAMAKEAGASSVAGTLRKNMPFLQDNLSKFVAKGGVVIVSETENDIDLFKEI